ncbi:MAG: c-type cytochrome, partial [Planctomycetota bacterium]
MGHQTGSRWLAGLAGLALLSAGCQRTAVQEWQPSDQVQKLPQELSATVTKAVMHHSGTVLEPRVVGIAVAATEPEKMRQQLRLKHGQAVYMKRCYQCHGVAGDGRGPVADSLYPRPRDYTPGI